MSDLHADETQLRAFMSAIFRYATQDTYIALRGFGEGARNVPAFLVRPLKVNGSQEAMLTQVVAAAEDCAQAEAPAVFAPPVCTFNNPYYAKGSDVADGLTLSVEIDNGDPDKARQRLEGLIGAATVVVRSGSDWVDADTGEIKPKLHLHWRLSEPTCTPAEHETLRLARVIATTLVGADPTGTPVAHPFRWPGSWHRKATPRLTTATYNEDAEINLTEALDVLEGAMEAEGRAKVDMPSSGTPEAPLRDVASAMAAIPNPASDVPYDQWVRLGYAIHRATGGGQDGFLLWDEWSAKSDKYNATETAAVWRRIATATAGKSPPRTIGAGTIFYLAGAAGWVRPFPFSGSGAGHSPHDADAEWFARQFNPDNRTDKADNRTKQRPAILSLPELDALPPPEWLIEGLIPEASLTFAYGPPKAGKTFIILSMALHVAAGLPWFGKKVRQGAVVYIAGEGVGGLSMRIRAMRAYHSIPINIPFWVIPRAVNFRSDDDVRALAKLVRATVANVPVKLAIVDTLARAMPGADENSAQETGLVIHAMEWLKEELNATCLPIHHQGKDAERGARGTSALRGAWDAALQITASGKGVTLTVADQKDAEAGETMRFDMVEQLVTASRSSLVPVLNADPEPGTEQEDRAPGGVSGILYRSILDIMSGPESAIIPPDSDIPPDVRGVTIDRVRQTFNDRSPAPTLDAKRKAFERSLIKLQERRLIGVKSPWVWVV